MSSGPSAPNANDLSNAQTQSNIKTATAQTGLNAINQVGPGGSSTYQQIGTWPDGTPRFQQNTTLSAGQQGIYDKGVANQQNIANAAGGLSSQIGNTLGQPIGNFNDVRQQTLDSLNGELDQRSDRDLASTQQQLANQGIQQGTEAYSNAMRDFNTGRSANRTQAILAANQAQGQAQDLSFGNRNQSINELMSLMNGSQAQLPQQSGTPQSSVAGTDVSGNAMNAYNAQQQQNNQFWSGLGSLGGTLGGFLFSDRRLKTDVRDTGMETPGGVSIKDFRYKGSPMMQRGVIAQEVARKQPEAVRKGPGGFLMVAPRMVK